MLNEVRVSVYETPPAIFDVFARVFPEKSSEQYKWVTFRSDDGVVITLFLGTEVPA